MKLNRSKTKFLLAGAMVLSCGALVPARADYQSTVLSQGPEGYWRLNETTVPVPPAPAHNFGSLGSSADGTYNNFPVRGLAGPVTGGVAVGLDGSATSITTPWQAGIGTSPFSAEIWANPAQVPKFAYLFSSVQTTSPRSGWYMAQDDGSVFGLGSAFVVRMFYQNGATPAITLSAPIDTAGVWYHIVLTFDGTTASLYTNGVLSQSGTPAGYVGNAGRQFSVGMRSDANFNWPGKVAEVALYPTALSAARVIAHHSATTSSAAYAAAVNADSPNLYWRFIEPPDPVAVNAGTLGSAVNGLYLYDAKPGVAGPESPAYPGFEAANKSVAFDAVGGAVQIPPLGVATDSLTICAWVNGTNVSSEIVGAGIVVCRGGTTVAGLTIDPSLGGAGLGYNWAGNTATTGWSPSADSGLPGLPESDWAFVALVVQPSQAAIFICDRTNYANFTGATNPAAVVHVSQPFDGPTLIGADSGKYFDGAIDEVAIFNRALSEGELYTQYGAAVGGVPPKIFVDLQGPSAPVAVGDPIVLTVDAGGTPALTYFWHKNNGPYTTTTSNTLTIASASLGDNAVYDVTVSNLFGTVPSQQVAVTVVTASTPTISAAHGFQNRSLYPGGTLHADVVATGGGLKYQWYKNSAVIPSATTSAYTIARVVATNAGSYSVSITNAAGTASNGPVTIGVITPASGSYEDLIVTAAPEAWWRLDEAPGSTNLWDGMGRHDGSYRSQNSTVPPVTLGVAGALSGDPNTAASFNPASQGVGVIPYSPALNKNQASVEAWVKTTVLNGSLVPFSNAGTNSDGYWCQTVGGFWVGDGPGGEFGYNPNTAATIASGQWSYVVIRYDGNEVIGGTHYPYTLFVNGQSDGFVYTGPNPNTSGPFIIGGRNAAPPALADLFFDGQVDEVAVYGRLLSGTEMTSHFNGRFGTTTPPYFVGAFLPQTVTTGKTINYTTTVYGSLPITLQWYKGGSRISGATTTSLTISNTAVSDTGTYTLWATNGAGTASQSVGVTVMPPVSYANFTNDLVLHLRFDGDTTDSSGHGNNGTPVGSPAFVSGLIGSGALQYMTETISNISGTTVTNASYVSFGTAGSGPPPDLQLGTGSFTIGLWAKFFTNAPFNSLPGDLPFIGTATNSNNNPGWDLSPSYQAGGWQWCLNDGTVNLNMNGANNSINDGFWHNFVLSVDRGAQMASTYLDGVLVAQIGTASLGNIDNNNYWPVVVGQDPTGLYTEPGSTILDDLGIWKQPLSAVEVAKIESAGRTGHSFDTVAPPVTITVTRSGSSVTLHYAAGTLLQSSSLSAGALWAPVPGASPPSYTVTPGPGNNYYKVQTQ